MLCLINTAAAQQLAAAGLAPAQWPRCHTWSRVGTLSSVIRTRAANETSAKFSQSNHGGGPSRVLLCDYDPSCGPSFELWGWSDEIIKACEQHTAPACELWLSDFSLSCHNDWLKKWHWLKANKHNMRSTFVVRTVSSNGMQLCSKSLNLQRY